MHRVRTARHALLTREHSPSSNSAQASFPDYDEIKYSSNYRNNTISFPLPSTRWQHTYQRGNSPTPLLPRRPTQSQRYQSRACNLDTPPKYSQKPHSQYKVVTATKYRQGLYKSPPHISSGDRPCIA